MNERDDYERYAQSTDKQAKSYGTAWFLSAIPVFLAFGVLAAIAVHGGMTTETCYEVSTDEDASEFVLGFNWVTVGIAAGIAFSSFIPSIAIGGYTKALIGLLLIAVSSIAVNSYEQLGDSCDEDKILTQKRLMFIVMGTGIGLVVNGTLLSLLVYVPGGWQVYLWLTIAAVGAILLAGLNIWSYKECNKDDLSQDEQDSVGSILWWSVGEIVAGLLLIGLISFLVFKVGFGIEANMDYQAESFRRQTRTD
jgi:uncharacterized membrane protein YidH (DUF202 family)